VAQLLSTDFQSLSVGQRGLGTSGSNINLGRPHLNMNSLEDLNSKEKCTGDDQETQIYSNNQNFGDLVYHIDNGY
jgi:hypothetical protein